MNHPFRTHIVTRYSAAPTPIGDLARKFKAAHDVPSSGDLRPWVADALGIEWLPTFDKAWAEFAAPRCLAPACTAKAAGGASSYCPAHGGRPHVAGRP